ncbi:hypothetical protein Gorai_018293 [Gossypium raimondii]|uniref:Flavin-containing monooxygenase n=1 Tax=Gossypium raimondii TaxID=29730 RepID=A0A7J8PK87_GOSRA|nr:hypothetical protein [Gossypium raimondii]
MGFTDYPFMKKEGGDPRTFPGHEEVLKFLEDFVRDFRLMELIRFGHEVVRVELTDEARHKWVVESRTRETESRWESKEELFEAVVICNGKHTEPKIAEFPGRDAWPGLQMHSHSYRTPEQFENKIVVLIGNGSSAKDILKEISPLASQVHQAIRGPDSQLKRLENHDNAWQHSMTVTYQQIECARKDGKVVFQDGSIVDADVIIHCTGYKFHFPFLRSNGTVTVDDNRVGPLYKHVFPPSLAPSLSFVALPYKVKLPTQAEMADSVEELYRLMEKSGRPKHLTHTLQQDKFEYENWLATQLDIRPPERWKEIMFFSMEKIKSYYGDKYRDAWDVDKWIQEVDCSN